MKFRSLMSLSMILLLTLTAAQVQSQDKPSTRPADDLKSWFKQLSDSAPDVRERARLKLMTMSRARLDELKTVVVESRPLSAAQALELRQIVEHVFLSGEEYLSEPRGGRGFLGVQLAPVLVPEAETASPAGSNAPDRVVTRVMISTRFPGFNSYAMLRDGDVLISIVGSDVHITSVEDLPGALTGREPGTTIELEVQRAGQLLRVPVRLSPRPLFLNGRNPGENSATFGIDREEAATKYWEANFAKLLDQQTL